MICTRDLNRQTWMAEPAPKKMPIRINATAALLVSLTSELSALKSNDSLFANQKPFRVRKYREEAKNGGTPVVYLNAGDTYTGTAWFTVFKDNITSAFLNKLQPDAIVRYSITLWTKDILFTAMESAVKCRWFQNNSKFICQRYLLSYYENSILLNYLPGWI